MTPDIRVGVGGWDYAPWRESFYPPGLPKARGLEFMSRALTAVEVNGTFYRAQTPKSFRRWADETPENFVFALKGSRYVVTRPALADAGPGVQRFLESGLIELGAKLGPLLWQLAPNRPFVEADVAAFLELLPTSFDGHAIRHALEVRHASFVDPRFVALARRFGVAIVYADSDVHPAIADQTGPFVYARLQRSSEAEPSGYPAPALENWAERARIWASGGAPSDLPLVMEVNEAPPGPRPVFLFVISGFKPRAPAAARALVELLRA